MAQKGSKDWCIWVLDDVLVMFGTSPANSPEAHEDVHNK
jgi:hypothetical protein